jgi:hypothetical protein
MVVLGRLGLAHVLGQQLEDLGVGGQLIDGHAVVGAESEVRFELEDQFGYPDVTLLDGQHQRGLAVPLPDVDVGAFVDQQGAYLGVAVEGSHAQGSVLPAIAQLEFGPELEQGLDHRQVALADCHHQGGEAVGVLHVQVVGVLDQGRLGRRDLVADDPLPEGLLVRLLRFPWGYKIDPRFKIF